MNSNKGQFAAWVESRPRGTETVASSTLRRMPENARMSDRLRGVLRGTSGSIEASESSECDQLRAHDLWFTNSAPRRN